MATQRSSSSTSQYVKKRKGDDSSCSEEEEEGEEENIIASSSSSSSAPQYIYDVFLNFYGKDTRKSFTDHLHVDLKRKGINVYKDDEALERGKYIPQELSQAIQESQYGIVILSANYASSKWCLRELAKIVEWEEKKKLKIIPIFYHVDPSDVRNQIGPFAEAFAAHEKDNKVDTKEIDTWKNAFRKVGNIAGEHIHHDRYESEIIQKICEKISNNYTMQNILIHDKMKLVAINSRVEQMMKLLDMESNDIHFLGIHGMGGVGKTTLAEVIYDRVSCQYEGSSFISCIREKASAHGLAYLQKQLLSMIMREKILVWDHHQGISMLRSMLRNKKVFIVLDDVDSEKQLMALAGNQDWFGAGSRVLITCRDSHLLVTHKVNDIYKVKLLQIAHALQLFSLSALGKTHPPENYRDLCMDFVRYAQGLPLALKVLGSFLFDRTIDAWKSARDKLEANPNREIMNMLEISFEGLEDSQKKLFLDVACFSDGQWATNYIFEEIYPGIDIEVLIDKALLKRKSYIHDLLKTMGQEIVRRECPEEPGQRSRLFRQEDVDKSLLKRKSISSQKKKSYWGMLVIHALLKKMGQEIVRRECPEEPGQRSRLFRQEDVFHVMKNDTGTDAIEAIVLNYSPDQTKESLNANALSKMRNLRWLKFPHSQNIEWRGDPLKYMPTAQLRILDWSGYHLKFWPRSFQPKNLTILRMHGSRFKRLWKRSMVLCNLKEFDLSFSENLIETPDFTGTPNLEKILLLECNRLCELHPSIGVLKRLEVLSISGYCIEQKWKVSTVLDLTNLKDFIGGEFDKREYLNYFSNILKSIYCFLVYCCYFLLLFIIINYYLQFF